MKESDWRLFKQIKEKAIEHFCQRVLGDKRYLLLYKLVQNRDKQMQLLFDVHSRSQAPIQLTAIRSEGLADESLLSKLSDEFLEATDPKLYS